MNSAFFSSVVALAAMVAAAPEARAVDADHFRCSFVVTSASSGRSTKFRNEFDIARLPLNYSPAPDVRITSGEASSALTFDLDGVALQANVRLHYQHAVRVDAQLKPTDGRIATCSMMMVGRACEGPLCSEPQGACGWGTDPYSPVQGWRPVPMIGDTPGFAPASSGSSTDFGGDAADPVPRGRIDFKCDYLYTSR